MSPNTSVGPSPGVFLLHIKICTSFVTSSTSEHQSCEKFLTQIQRLCNAAQFSEIFSELLSATHYVIAVFCFLSVFFCFISNIAVILVTANDERLNMVVGVLRKNTALSDMMFGITVGLLYAISELLLITSIRSR